MTHKADYPTICVISPEKSGGASTFIRAHIERLPGRVMQLYGSDVRSLQDDLDSAIDRPFTLWRHAGQVVARRLFGHSWEDLAIEPLRRYLIDQNVDVVLAEYGPVGVMVMTACRKAGVPLVVHFHGYDAYEQPTIERMGHRYVELFESAAAIVAVSREMEQQLLYLGTDRAKLHHNPYGVDLSLFQKTNAAQNPPLFIAVGGFVNKKAPDLTLHAFARVHQTIPEARLIMIGGGPLWDVCNRLIALLEVETAVDLLGPRPHTEVASLMRQARVFVQHSIRARNGNSEGTPNAILEASATGLPVVATRHAGIVDAVIEDVTGFLVDEGDVAAMAGAMIRLANDPSLAGQLGSAGRERIQSEYAMEARIQSLYQVLTDVIN